MTETKNIEKKLEEITSEGNLPEQESIERDESDRAPQSILIGIQKFIGSLKRRGKPVKPPDPRQDRTRALVLLIGGIVGSVLLFFGVFSTPPGRPNQTQRNGTQPNLGRKETSAPARLASATPLLSAQVQADESGQDRLSAADIQNTSQRNVASGQHEPEVESQRATERRDHALPQSVSKAAPPDNPIAVPITYSYGAGKASRPSSGPDEPTSFSDPFRPLAPGPSNPPATMNSLSPKSSIVFIRSGNGSPVIARNPSQSEAHLDPPALLPPGSRLIARLESSVTSALKTPVVADIEYNYEKDGAILVPAGTKAIGELQQTSANGYVGIVFHTLQMPDGRYERIDATAMDLRNEPLKGKVTGTNKGRKFLTRTLTGVGTIAAYVVGAGDSSQSVTSGTLLRDRLAGNISSAGEQELANAAYAQNIVVTLPAQTRLYIVFQKAAIEQTSAAPPRAGVTSSGPPMPTAQELRELMDLRRELNQMYSETVVPQSSATP
jgi:type IV secretory pathway VirB10-like protein